MKEIENIRVLSADDGAASQSFDREGKIYSEQTVTAVTLDGKTLDQLEKIECQIGINISNIHFHELYKPENDTTTYSLTYDIQANGNEISSRSLTLTENEAKQILAGIDDCREQDFFARMMADEEKPRIEQDEKYKNITYKIWTDSAGAYLNDKTIGSVDFYTGEYKVKDKKSYDYLPPYQTTAEAMELFKVQIQQYVDKTLATEKSKEKQKFDRTDD